MNWLEFFIFIAAFAINSRLTLWVYHWRNKRQQVKYLMYLRMTFPDTLIDYTSVGGTEGEALRNLQIKMQGGDAGTDEVDPVFHRR